MELSPKTKIADLLDAYPFMLDYLVRQSSHFKKLRNPVLRKTMGKVANLSMAAEMGEIALGDFMAGIAAEIERQTGQAPTGQSLEAEPLVDPGQRQDALKAIIRDLHDGVDMEVLKERFRALINNVDAPEIAGMEQQLINEGMPVEEVKRLCDVHVELFKDALEEHEPPEPPPGHPVHTYMQENRASERIISDLMKLIGRLGRPPQDQALEEHRGQLAEALSELAKIDVHYTRKENQLFPMLEEHHFTGPSQVMWAVHDEIRAGLKQARQAFDQGDAAGMVQALEPAVQAVRDMVYKEEHILYPTSLDMLSESEWVTMHQGDEDIGFAWVEPDPGWPGEATGPAPEPTPPAALEAVKGLLALDTGNLSDAQVNMMLTHLPVDLTFVDADDRVAYYSEGPERIFPRSPAAIGREVRNCHPPASVHKVNRILDSFKSGAKDNAAFWIQMGPRLIYIRYFALRDEQGVYQGCLEVSQDITELQKLEGEQRLLDWD